MLRKFITSRFDNLHSSIFLCVIGAIFIGYGMLKDDNPIFIIGIVVAIGGYVLIRRKIKEYSRNNP